MAEGLRFAGDIQIDRINVVSTKDQLHTITPQVLAIEIYEDMFAPFTSGNIIVRDSQEFSSLLPLMGEEVLTFYMSTPGVAGTEFKRSFAIYRMGERIQVSKDNVAFMLFFMSKEGVIDQNRKISKGYYGKIAVARKDPKIVPDLDDPNTCIVEKIISDPLALANVENKGVIIEDSDSTIRYVSNFWSPVQNINFVAQSTVSPINNSPTYIFFENRDGFNYVSLDYLIENNKTPLQKFTYEKEPLNITEHNPEEDYKRIIDFNTQQTFDYMKRLQSGMYGTEIISFDLMTKQYAHVGFKPEFEKRAHLNTADTQSKMPPAHHRNNLVIQPKCYNNFDDYQDTTNFKIIQDRLGQLASAESFKLQVTVHGRLDYTVGKSVYLSFPLYTQQSQALENSGDLEDKVYSGLYLISALCHKINRKKHFCIMECIKESHMKDMETVFYDP